MPLGRAFPANPAPDFDAYLWFMSAFILLWVLTGVILLWSVWRENRQARKQIRYEDEVQVRCASQSYAIGVAIEESDIFEESRYAVPVEDFQITREGSLVPGTSPPISEMELARRWATFQKWAGEEN